MSKNLPLFVCYPPEKFENIVGEKKIKSRLPKKSTSKSSRKLLSKPHSSHVKFTLQDILDVTKWQQEKWPRKSLEFNNKLAIHLLKTSHHSLDYLKGNAAARAAWAKFIKKNSRLNKKVSKSTKKVSKATKKVSIPTKKVLKAIKKVSIPTKKVLKAIKKVSIPTKKVEKFENNDTTPTEPPTYTKSTYIPLFNMSYHTDNDKNKQLCIGNTCATQNDIMSLISKKLF